MKGFECENCNVETDGSYIDRGKVFCSPKCAMEQAKELGLGSGIVGP